jgi:hypothetical protein
LSKVIIVAPNKTIADMVAKQHNLRPWDWNYGFNPQSLRGRTPKDTVFVHDSWHDTTPGHQMTAELRHLRNIGVDIVMVST